MKKEVLNVKAEAGDLKIKLMTNGKMVTYKLDSLV